MRIRFVIPGAVALALLLAACGGSSGSSSGGSPTTVASGSTAPSGTPTTVHVARAAENVPSVSAKMICEAEAATDIYEQATGVKTIEPLHPAWVNHIYSCRYVYPQGAVITLSVKEVSDVAETTSYFNQLAATLDKTKDIAGLGQGAFQVKDGSMVVRKDYKVLLIDVTKLPAQFGVPADTRGDVAINIAEAIMGCWTGA